MSREWLCFWVERLVTAGRSFLVYTSRPSSSHVNDALKDVDSTISKGEKPWTIASYSDFWSKITFFQIAPDTTATLLASVTNYSEDFRSIEAITLLEIAAQRIANQGRYSIIRINMSNLSGYKNKHLADSTLLYLTTGTGLKRAMPRLESDIKLDFKDVLIRPKRSTLKSRSQVDVSRTYIFRNSKMTWTGVVSSKFNCWSWFPNDFLVMKKSLCISTHSSLHPFIVHPSYPRDHIDIFSLD